MEVRMFIHKMKMYDDSAQPCLIPLVGEIKPSPAPWKRMVKQAERTQAISHATNFGGRECTCSVFSMKFQLIRSKALDKSDFRQKAGVRNPNCAKVCRTSLIRMT